MPFKPDSGPHHVRDSSKLNVGKSDDSAFEPLTPIDIREAFAVPATIPPILSLSEAAGLVKLRPQTLKRKVSEGLYAKSVVRGKPLRFWRDRLVMEVMR
jgi:hypothetical protein